jgi:hypothetical protein
MKDSDERRTTWMVRINVRQSAQDAIREIAIAERIPMATAIGIAIENYVTARSTA